MRNAVPADARNALRAALIGVGLCAGAVAHAGSPQELTIRMQKESFVPANASVAAGTRIIWINSDTIPHSVTAGDNGFDSVTGIASIDAGMPTTFISVESVS